MMLITAVILTRNEEVNLPQCLNSLKDVVDEIIVVDSYSEDNTAKIARQYGCNVYHHHFVNYGAQFQYALDNTEIHSRWVLRIDADERLTEESSREILNLCKNNLDTDVAGIIMHLKIRFMGRELRYGGAYPMRKLCIFKPECAFMEARYMDEQIVLTQGKTIEMITDVEHADYKDLSFWISKHNWYATRAAKDYLDNVGCNASQPNLDFYSKLNRFVKFKIYYKLPSRFRTSLLFFYRYIIQGGFLDGRQGYWYAFFQTKWYRTLVDAKTFESELSGNDIGETSELK